MADRKRMSTKDGRGRIPAGLPTIAEQLRAARSRGEKWCDVGIACLHGHNAVRNSRTGECRECARIRPRGLTKWCEARTAAKEHGRRTYLDKEECKACGAFERGTTLRECVACRRARRREHAAKDPQKTRAYMAIYHEANRERAHEKRLEYKANFPEKIAHWARVRNERKRLQKSGSRRAYFAFIAWSKEADSVSCYWCKADTAKGNRNIDHIVPLVKGGADSVANLCIACPTCNQRKGSKSPQEFSGQSELLLA